MPGTETGTGREGEHGRTEGGRGGRQSEHRQNSRVIRSMSSCGEGSLWPGEFRVGRR